MHKTIVTQDGGPGSFFGEEFHLVTLVYIFPKFTSLSAPCQHYRKDKYALPILSAGPTLTVVTSAFKSCANRVLVKAFTVRSHPASKGSSPVSVPRRRVIAVTISLEGCSPPG